VSTSIEYRVRIRDAADTVDVLVITSTRGGTNPYLCEAPHGDGSEFDPFTGAYRSGSHTFRIADAITSGTTRVLTSQLEDADFRQQLASRPAYGEERINGGAWTSLQAGIVTGMRLSTAAIWELDIGDATRATRNLNAFAPLRRASNATKVELFTDYLTRWPKRGCIAGGPVIGGFLRAADSNGWEMQVATVTGSGATRVVGLHFVSGYQVSTEGTTPDFFRSTNPDDFRDRINEVVGKPSSYIASSFPDDFPTSPWRDIIVQVGSNYFAVAGVAVGPFLSERMFQLSSAGAELYVADPNSLLSTGSTIVRVRIFDALPTDRCPIYYSGHPIDLWTKLCDEAGLKYNAAGVSACRDALGRGMRIHLRIPSVQAWASWVESVLYGPCGFSVRTNGSNELVPYATRITTSAAPATVVTNADVSSDASVLFDLSEPDAITKVTFNMQNLLPRGPGTATAATVGGPRTAIARVATPPDGVVVQKVLVERLSGDGGGPVQREQSYTIPGFVAADDAAQVYDPQYVDHFAAQIFDRMGRGRLTGEVPLLRSPGAGGALLLGDEFVCQVKAMPNHNKRYGDDNTVGGRAVQIVRLTPSPTGPRVRFLDSGPNANAVATLPTLSLALGTTPGSVLATITNAATLNASSIAVRLYWAVTTGAAPVTADYSAVTYFKAGAVPTAAFALPVVTPGLVVYVLGRGEKAGFRPSSNGTAQNITTATIGAPTAFTATPDGTDGSICVLTWAIGTNASALATDIFLRLTGDPVSNDVLRITLPAGSTQYTLTHLTPSGGYTASLLHRDPASNVSTAKVTAAFTQAAGATTLPAPINPVGVVGSIDARGIPHVDGTYGLDVTATSVPGFIEFLVAIETGVGAGTYGTAASAAILPAISGNPTSFRAVAPSDGLKRQLTARHVRTGATTSTSTAGVNVNPWGALSVPGALTLSLSVGTCTASNGGVVGPPWNQLIVAFNASGFPIGTTFDVSYNNSVSGGVDSQTVTASPATFASVTFAGSPGSGAVTVVAKWPGGSITATKNKPYPT
jgi:hypothetical protein